MCVMSAVTDHYQRQWPVFNPQIQPYQPFVPQQFFEGMKFSITMEQWAEYQRLKQAAAEIDEKTGQPDCVKPGVAEWEEQMVKNFVQPAAE